MSETFESLVAKTFDFYGASEQQFKLNDVVWKAIEDQCDGYRSCLGSVEVKESNAIFFQTPLAKVIVKEIDTNSTKVFELVDVEDNHVWLRFGTENYDDYYPYFVFEYQPKEKEAVK